LHRNVLFSYIYDQNIRHVRLLIALFCLPFFSCATALVNMHKETALLPKHCWDICLCPSKQMKLISKIEKAYQRFFFCCHLSLCFTALEIYSVALFWWTRFRSACFKFSFHLFLEIKFARRLVLKQFPSWGIFLSLYVPNAANHFSLTYFCFLYAELIHFRCWIMD